MSHAPPAGRPAGSAAGAEPDQLHLLPGPAENGGAVPPPPEDYAGVQDGFRYTKTTLSPQARYLYDQLLTGLQDQAEEISGLYPDTDLIQTAVDAISRDYPELLLVLRHRSNFRSPTWAIKALAASL